MAQPSFARKELKWGEEKEEEEEEELEELENDDPN